MTHTIEGVLDQEEQDNLGRGIAFGDLWDFNISAGSMQVDGGLSVLGRDLAWSTSLYLGGTVRGETLNPEFKEDIIATVVQITEADSRVEEGSVKILSIEESTDSAKTIEIEMELTAITGERGEFILQI